MAQKKESKWVTIVYALAALICLTAGVLSFVYKQTMGGTVSLVLGLAMLCMALAHFAVLRAQAKNSKNEEK